MFKKLKQEITAMSKQECEHDIIHMAGLLSFISTLSAAMTIYKLTLTGINFLSLGIAVATVCCCSYIGYILWLQCSIYSHNVKKD